MNDILENEFRNIQNRSDRICGIIDDIHNQVIISLKRISVYSIEENKQKYDAIFHFVQGYSKFLSKVAFQFEQDYQTPLNELNMTVFSDYDKRAGSLSTINLYRPESTLTIPKPIEEPTHNIDSDVVEPKTPIILTTNLPLDTVQPICSTPLVSQINAETLNANVQNGTLISLPSNLINNEKNISSQIKAASVDHINLSNKKEENNTSSSKSVETKKHVAQSSLNIETPNRKQDNASKLTLKIRPLLLEVTAVQDISIQYVVSPLIFWIQPINLRADRDKLIKELNKFYMSKNGETRMVDCPVEKMYVVARYSVDSKWYRAKILKINYNGDLADSVEVLYVDYGNCENLPLDEIRLIDEKFCDLPYLAIPVTLANALPISEDNLWPRNVASKFSNSLHKYNFKATLFIEKEWPIYFCRLRRHDEDYVNKMVHKGYAKKGTMNEVISQFKAIIYQDISIMDFNNALEKPRNQLLSRFIQVDSEKSIVNSDKNETKKEENENKSQKSENKNEASSIKIDNNNNKIVFNNNNNDLQNNQNNLIEQSKSNDNNHYINIDDDTINDFGKNQYKTIDERENLNNECYSNLSNKIPTNCSQYSKESSVVQPKGIDKNISKISNQTIILPRRIQLSKYNGLDGFRCQVSHVESLDEFYVIEDDKKVLDSLFKLRKDLNEYYHMAIEYHKQYEKNYSYEINSNCIVRKSNKNFYRAIIKDVDYKRDNKNIQAALFYVQDIDSGVCDTVEYGNICQILDRFCDESYAIKCKMSFIKPRSGLHKWDADTIREFKSLVTKPRAFYATVYGVDIDESGHITCDLDEPLSVALTNVDFPNYLHEHLIKRGKALVAGSTNSTNEKQKSTANSVSSLKKLLPLNDEAAVEEYKNKLIMNYQITQASLVNEGFVDSDLMLEFTQDATVAKGENKRKKNENESIQTSNNTNNNKNNNIEKNKKNKNNLYTENQKPKVNNEIELNRSRITSINENETSHNNTLQNRQHNQITELIVDDDNVKYYQNAQVTKDEANLMVDWNPMFDHYNDPANLYQYNDENVECVLTGYESQQLENVCKTFQKTGKCTRKNCPFWHTDKTTKLPSCHYNTFVRKCFDANQIIYIYITKSRLESDEIHANVLSYWDSYNKRPVRLPTLKELTNRMNDYYGKHRFLNKKSLRPYNLKELVVVHYVKTNNWYRAQVEQQKDEYTYLLKFIDIGVSKVSNIRNIYPIEPTFLYYHRMSYKIKLIDINNNNNVSKEEFLMKCKSDNDRVLLKVTRCSNGENYIEAEAFFRDKDELIEFN